MVALAGRKGRPEETVAPRRCWFELDRPRPRIALHNAEVYHPLPGGAPWCPSSTAVTQRCATSTSTKPLVALLRHHLETYVAEPVPDSRDPDRRNPWVFTTLSGHPIDQSNWGAAGGNAPHVRHSCTGRERLAVTLLPLLRAAAITSWLQDGRSLDYCARTADNSQALIRSTTRACSTRSATRPRSLRAEPNRLAHFTSGFVAPPE